jgi:hypothetical protein
MPPTVIRGTQVLDGSIQRADLDVSTIGQAVIAKIVQGAGITLSSTGADSGTGDVTVSTAAAFVTKTAAYTLTVADSGKYVICSGGSWTLTLPAPAVGLNYRLRNDMGVSGTTGTITLSPTGGTIDGLASIPLLPQQECTLITDGANWRTHGLKREVILGTQDITSSTASAFVLLPAGYRYFELEWTGLQTVTDDQNLLGQVSIDGGSTWLTAANYFSGLLTNTSPTAAGNTYVNSGTFAYLSPGVYNNLITAEIKLTIYPGTAGTKLPSWRGHAGSFSTSVACLRSFVIHGYYNPAASFGPINAFKYFFQSGNIANSFLTVKGVV